MELREKNRADEKWGLHVRGNDDGGGCSVATLGEAQKQLCLRRITENSPAERWNQLLQITWRLPKE